MSSDAQQAACRLAPQHNGAAQPEFEAIQTDLRSSLQRARALVRRTETMIREAQLNRSTVKPRG
jgi:hypothetical protein